MRRAGGAACLALFVLAMGGVRGADRPQGKVTDSIVTGQSDGPRLSLTLNDAGLLEVAEELSRLSGQLVVIDARLVSKARLEVSFKDVTLADAVRSVAKMCGGRVAPLAGGGFLIYRDVQPRYERESIPVSWMSAGELAWSLGGTPIMGGELKPLLAGPRGELPEGIRSLHGFDLISALIAQGTPEGIAKLRELVGLLDRPPLEVNLGLRVVKLAPAAWASLAEPWRGLAADGAAMVISRDEANALVTKLVRDNVAEVHKGSLATQNGKPAELQYGDAAPRTLVLVPRVLGEASERSFLLTSELRSRVVAPGQPTP